MCERARVIIPGLLRKINALEGDVEALRTSNRFMRKLMMMGSLCCFLIFFFFLV